MREVSLKIQLTTLPGESVMHHAIRSGAANDLKECCKMIASQAADNRNIMIETLGLYLLIEAEKFAKL